jgi:cold-inducible RNA-binding protein
VNQILENRIKRDEREALVMTLKSLYVGNLPYHATEEDVRSLFADYSPSDVRVIHDKGFGFVEVSEDVADDAIAALNGVDFQGRSLTVNEARPRPERTDEGGYHRRR